MVSRAEGPSFNGSRRPMRRLGGHKPDGNDLIEKRSVMNRSALLNELSQAKLTFDRVKRMDNIGIVGIKMIEQGLFGEATEAAIEFTVREYPGFWNLPDGVNAKYWHNLAYMTEELIRAKQFSSALKVIDLSRDHLKDYFKGDMTGCYQERNWEMTLLLLTLELGKSCSGKQNDAADIKEMLPKITRYLVLITSLQLEENTPTMFDRTLATMLNAGFIANAFDYAVDRELIRDGFDHRKADFYPIDRAIDVLKKRGELKKLKEEFRAAMERASYSAECIGRNLYS